MDDRLKVLIIDTYDAVKRIERDVAEIKMKVDNIDYRLSKLGKDPRDYV